MLRPNETQEPEDFDHQIKRRFGEDWEKVWAEAVSLIQSVDRRDLDIQSRFFNQVYKPRRDLLAERWSLFGLRQAPAKKVRKKALPRTRRKQSA